MARWNTIELLAVIKPLIKKPNLDVNVLPNYRPISNLKKVLKKAI